MAHYKTYQTKVLKLNIAEVEKLTDSESQFAIRGRGNAKTKRSKFIGKTMDIPSADLEQIQAKLKAAKRKFFELTVSTHGGMTPEERSKKNPTRGRKPTATAKPISTARYLCEIKDDGAFVKAILI